MCAEVNCPSDSHQPHSQRTEFQALSDTFYLDWIFWQEHDQHWWSSCINGRLPQTIEAPTTAVYQRSSTCSSFGTAQHINSGLYFYGIDCHRISDSFVAQTRGGEPPRITYTVPVLESVKQAAIIDVYWYTAHTRPSGNKFLIYLTTWSYTTRYTPSADLLTTKRTWNDETNVWLSGI